MAGRLMPRSGRVDRVGLNMRFKKLVSVAITLLSTIAHPVVALEYALGCSTTCGNVTIQYPFGFTEACGLPQYRLNCTNDTGLVQSNASNPVLFLSTLSGQYQVLNVTSSSLIISARANLRASVNGSEVQSGTNAVSFEIADTSPYVVSSENTMFGYGCNVTATFTLQYGTAESVGSCSNGCDLASTIAPYCDIYPCCVKNMSINQKKVGINATHHIKNSFNPTWEQGYASIIYPESYSTPDGTEFGLGSWGIKLLWYFAGSCNNGSTCSDNSQCFDVSPGGVLNGAGHYCKCSEGYGGDGYLNGTSCFGTFIIPSPGLSFALLD